MRIPAHSIWRAFPELDAFGDEDCMQFVRRARREHRLLVWALPPIVWIAAFFTIFAVVGVVATALPTPAAPKWLPPEMRPALAVTVLLTLLVGGASLASMLARDAMMRRLLQGQIDKARCTRCQFSLLGLRVRHGAVKCPECGTDVVLAEIGLCEEDLIAAPTEPEPVHSARE